MEIFLSSFAIPSKNVLIVRRGLDRGGGFELAKFSADVLKALGL